MTVPIRERPSNEPSILAPVAADKDHALHFGGDHGIVRDRRGRLCCAISRRRMSDSLEEEVQGSFHAYASLWDARAELLNSVSRMLGEHVGCARCVRHARPGHHPG